MRFAVLGPVQVVTDGGAPVRVPELKVRALLAALLVDPGRPVATHRLIDALWGDGPGRQPGQPLRALQAKVSQLRRVLEEAEPGARELVVSRPPGYALTPCDDATDLHRFAELAARARTEDDPREKAALLTRALELWRGNAFADFAGEPFVLATANRLEEDRLAVTEELAEVRLALGEHAALTGELADLVDRYPLRERLRAVQLKALYRAGRQSEALAAYEDLRARLAHDLGLDPGPELVALHRAVLTQDPGLAAATVPPAPAAPRGNLPAPLTGLIGRDEEVAAIAQLLTTTRLVTLTGPGGVGKTRLSVAVGERVTPDFPDGVWLTELAALPGSAGVVEVAAAVAAVLGIRDDGTGGTDARTGSGAGLLAAALRPRRMLLVLDNCEHLIEPVAALAGHLLHAAPGLRVLATSQETLAVPGEHVRSVPVLNLPDAVALFAARASGLTLDAASTPAVEAICRRLDGIPLALELAATRVRALGVHRLLDRLDDRFRALGAAGLRGAPARQQTLRAMIDWSWELLTGPERAVLRRLAVHADGCTAEAAEEVCGDGGTDVAAEEVCADGRTDVAADEICADGAADGGTRVAREDVLDLLARLVDRSLVVPAVGADGGPRYRLLESVAAYSAERLAEAGEEAGVRARHLAHYTALAEEAAPRLCGPETQQWLERLTAESANFRSALDTSIRSRDSRAALRLVAALAWSWVLRGRPAEGRRALADALAVPGGGEECAALRAGVGAWRVGIDILSGDSAGHPERITAALRAYEGLDEPHGEARARWFLAHSLCGTGDITLGEALTTSALGCFRELGDDWGAAAALADRSVQRLVRGDLGRAGEDAAASDELFRRLGDSGAGLWTVHTLATLAEVHGDYARAARLQHTALGTARRLGLATQAAELLSGLGRVALLTGDLARAADLHEEARRLAAAHGFEAGEINAVLGLGLVARRAGDLDTAERHLRRVLDWHRAVGRDGGNALVLAELGFVAELRGEAADARALHEQSYATARTTGDPRALALALEGLAGAHTLCGRYADAALLLGAASAARTSAGAPLPVAERADVVRIESGCRTGTGSAERYEAAFARGAALSPDAARDAVGAGGPLPADGVPSMSA
ncbi:BTAD domain-containing putative transcriptional regulator [Streptomyces sp. NPDC058657]|uniref:BTAD domain-containing putative transcriptional regulator n=1 Tax=unclassified Streptomyces TaxID=2593676 RepID=UPI003653A04F